MQEKTQKKACKKSQTKHVMKNLYGELLKDVKDIEMIQMVLGSMVTVVKQMEVFIRYVWMSINHLVTLRKIQINPPIGH